MEFKLSNQLTHHGMTGYRFELAMLQVTANEVENLAPENETVSNRSFVPHVAELSFGDLRFLKALDLILQLFFDKNNHEDLPHVVERHLDVNKAHLIQVGFQFSYSCLLKTAVDLLTTDRNHVKLVAVFDERLRRALEDRLGQSC